LNCDWWDSCFISFIFPSVNGDLSLVGYGVTLSCLATSVCLRRKHVLHLIEIAIRMLALGAPQFSGFWGLGAKPLQRSGSYLQFGGGALLAWGIPPSGGRNPDLSLVFYSAWDPVNMTKKKEIQASSVARSGGLKSPEFEHFRKKLCFLQKRPLMIKFSKFCSESLHRDTDRRCWVQNWWKLSDGKSVKSCVV